MKQFLVGCLGFGLCLLASSADAQYGEDTAVRPPPQLRDSPAQSVRQWYGWQMLASDVASVALFAGGAAYANGQGVYERTPPLANVMVTAGIAGYALGAPALHFVHERPFVAVGSLGLRLAGPALGGLLGVAFAECPAPEATEYGSCGMTQMAMGASVGALAAIILDATLLGWSSAKVEAPATPRLGFAPVISNDGKRGELRV